MSTAARAIPRCAAPISSATIAAASYGHFPLRMPKTAMPLPKRYWIQTCRSVRLGRMPLASCMWLAWAGVSTASQREVVQPLPLLEVHVIVPDLERTLDRFMRQAAAGELRTLYSLARTPRELLCA